MRCHVVLLSVLLTVLASQGEGYRILCLFPFNGKSHFMMFDALCKGLARRGHQVDMISHFPTKTPRPNYNDIVDLNGTLKSVVNTFSVDYGKTIHGSIVYRIATDYGSKLCHLMAHEQMQKFIKESPKYPAYDLVITEFFGASCYMGFGPYLKAPLAVAASSLDMPYLDEIVANPLNSAIFPGLYGSKAVLVTFWDRLANAVDNFLQARRYFHFTADQTEIMRQYLGPEMPDIRDVERSVSLALVNSHHSFHGIRPTTPALVQLAGLHVEEDESKLSSELAAWLDAAEDGVVYFTLGSLMNIETLPESTILDLYASFAKIAPVRVLMKCANKTMLPAGLPGNLLTSPWIPQVPVLRHKNTRAFITHGGLMGSQEALHYGIPMIGIPVFADQFRNINIFVHKKMAVLMNLEDIGERTMSAALDAVLNDPSYMENARKQSAIFRDRPMSPMESAIYHVEYVIKHGADSLRSPAVDMPWWQVHLIDVYVFLSTGVLVLVSLLAIATRLLLEAFRRTRARASPRRKRKSN